MIDKKEMFLLFHNTLPNETKVLVTIKVKGCFLTIDMTLDELRLSRSLYDVYNRRRIKCTMATSHLKTSTSIGYNIHLTFEHVNRTMKYNIIANICWMK